MLSFYYDTVQYSYRTNSDDVQFSQHFNELNSLYI